MACVCVVAPAHAEHEGPWQRHTIDNSSKGADGVRLADANGDGLMDIVTGWEEGGVVRLYLNPGPEKAKDKWPAVTVGKANNVEDAVMVDLDNDGAIDVVSSCEGKTKTMYVHWGPKDKAKLLDESAWETEPIPATAGKQMWMYSLPMQIDNKLGIDLVVGSKGKDASVGWLEPPQDPRDLKAWEYHRAQDAGWVMSLEGGVNSPPTIFVSDRKGPGRGLYFLTYKEGSWHRTDCTENDAEYMFADFSPHGEASWHLATATRDGEIRLVTITTPCRSYHMVIRTVPNPFGVKHGKAVAIGKIDDDEHTDLVVSFNTQGEKEKPGVAWIKVLPDKDPKDWPAYNISGPEGKKFDRIELIDLDGDGDLDVLTCEEADNLGVIWYENPYGSVKQ